MRVHVRGMWEGESVCVACGVCDRETESGCWQTFPDVWRAPERFAQHSHY